MGGRRRVSPKPVELSEIFYFSKPDLRRRRARQHIFCPFRFCHGDWVRGFALAASRNHILRFVFAHSGAALTLPPVSDAGKVRNPEASKHEQVSKFAGKRQNRPGPRGHPYRSQSAGRPTCFPPRTLSASGRRAWESCVGPLAFARCMSRSMRM